jgi:hypothetical protein
LVDALACAAGLALLLVPAMVDAKGRLLHDRLTSTRIVREG